MQLLYLLFEFVVLLFSVSCHECAHAWMASRLGDQTARLYGRITLNPIQHIDLWGTIFFPLVTVFFTLLGYSNIMLGWGKPIPVTTRNFRRITRDDNLSTAAGLVAHLLLALAGFASLMASFRLLSLNAFEDKTPAQLLLDSAPQAIVMLSYLMVKINLALFFFNLLPIPPLDGSRILRNLLPYHALETFDQVSRFSICLVFFIGGPWVDFILPKALLIVDLAMTQLR